MEHSRPYLALARPVRTDEPRSIEFMLSDLKRSGLTPEDIGAYPVALQAMDTTPAYVIPYRHSWMWRVRYDRTVDKYGQPPKVRAVWWSPHQDIETFKAAPVIYIVEGEKKAAAFVKKWPHLPVFGIGGAHMAVERLETGQRKLMDDILAVLKPGQSVIAVFDGDIETKIGIQQAAHILATTLAGLGVQLHVFRPPLGKGVDDWLVEDPDASLKDLVLKPLDELAISRKNLYQALGLQITEKGTIHINDINIRALLVDYYKGRAYRDKRCGIIKDGATVQPIDMEWESIEYIQTYHASHANKSMILSSLDYAMGVNQRDLVAEAVKAVEWDGTPRLETWGSQYFESDIPKYANAWGKILMMGLALRLVQPGIKHDYVNILVGAQGIGKSTFFEDLSVFGGRRFYHACTNLSTDANDGNRTQAIAFHRSVIVDLAEGVVFESKKAAMDIIKQRIAQTEDEYRQVYARNTTIEKRSFIFVGTSNRMDQLSDTTGTRRYLPLQVYRITKLPYFDKLQILAEVLARRQELEATNWYDLDLKLEDVPQQLREEMPHISKAQDLINSQFTKHSSLEEFIVSLCDSNEFAKLKQNMNVGYITAGYIASRSSNGNSDFGSKNLIARILSSLAASPTCPFRFERVRKRLPQLDIPEQFKHSYTDGIQNEQLMINGYTVERKRHVRDSTVQGETT
jgi:hypothetical protein